MSFLVWFLCNLQDFTIFSKFTLVANYFGDQGSKSRMCMVKGAFISILWFTLCFLWDFNFVLYKLCIETWHAFLNNKCLSYIFYDGCQNVSPFICTPSFSHSPVIYDIISLSFSALDRVFLELTTSWSRISNSGQGWWMGAWEAVCVCGNRKKVHREFASCRGFKWKIQPQKNPHIAITSTKVKVINFKSVLNRFFLCWVGTLSGSRSTEKQEIRWPH